MSTYRSDIAYIHAAGFGWYALESATGILKIFRDNGVTEGLVVDLGCGNGIWPRQLGFAGYSPVGVDDSASMIQLAKKTAPSAEFITGDLLTVDLPRCDAVTSIGEVLSYALEADSKRKRMLRLFRRVFRALRPGGVFVFDFGTPGQNPGGMPRKDHWVGPDWAILLRAEEDGDVMMRQLISFRKRGSSYRRSEEIHRVRLYNPGDVAAELTHAGFYVKRLTGFGEVRFRSGHAGFLARKPG